MARWRPCWLLGGLLLLSGLYAGEAEDQAAADVKLLQEQGVKNDGDGTLSFLRDRSLNEEEQARLTQLIKQLGDNDFMKREAASQLFVRRGQLSVLFLKAALSDPDPEIARRAQACLDDISGGPGPALPAAALRQLVRQKPTGAVEMLLRYLPFADDEATEEDCLTALRALGVQGGKAVAPLVAALQDKEPHRRAAAAYLVASVKDETQRRTAARLLSDEAPLVRFRTVQGMLAARDPQCLPVLIDFLRDGPPDILWRAEELLIRIAGDKAPSSSLYTPEERKKAHEEWSAWWKTNAAQVNLARLDDAPPFLNYTLVCEMHGNKIWEVDAGGKVRWTMDKLNCPRDAQILPGGRVLITEVNDNKVREREIATSKILWEHAINDPSFVRRLPNGNTFLANHALCYEITPDGKKVFEYQAKGGELVHSIDRKANGNVVCLMMSGQLRELNRAGAVVRELNLSEKGGNWCGVQALNGNRYLCVELNNGDVIEIDGAGKEQWKCRVQGACYAQRLPNGRTMICSFNGQRVVQVDQAGKIVAETKVGTQPWRSRVR